METKAKKFSHKLLALFLAVVMGITCFSGVLSAYAASKDVKYVDSQVEYNSLGWPVLADEQLATAVLDYADQMLASLAGVEAQLSALVAGANIPVVKINWDLNKRQVTVKALGITLATVTVKLTSIDELFETLESVDSTLHGGLVNTAGSLGLDLGNIPDLDFSAIKGMRRSTTSSCDMVRGVLGLIYDNIDIINLLLRGELSLGLLNDSVDVYGLIGGLVSAPSGYQSDMIYNIAKYAIFNLTKWYSADEIAAFEDGSAEFKFDEQLVSKLTTELLDKISVLVTYGQEYEDEETGKKTQNTSATRYVEIKNYMDANGVNYAAAAAACGYDPNIVYSDEFQDADGNYTNVLLFAYGSPDANGLATDDTEQIVLGLNDSLFSFGYQALKMAWSTVLKDTVKLLHVNYDYDWQVDENGNSHGSNFDNAFYYWMDKQGLWTGTDADYSAANVQAWAADVYEAYAAESADEFLGWVEDNLTFDRQTLVESEHGAWSTIDATKLFLKLRYSPLADKYFDIETGPINLYFLQTGTPNLDQFFDTDYANYKSLVAGLNDALVAAVKDIFVESDNINGTVPSLTKVGQAFTSVGTNEINQIADTLVANTLKMVQYTADAMDANVLHEFYTNNGAGTALSEQNIEEAMIPLLVACIGQVKLNGAGNLSVLIHPEDWDMCKDAEAVAFVALREYLSYVLPELDYNTLVTVEDGAYQATLNGTILPMARDAVFYVLESLVPVVDGNGNPWMVEKQSTITYTEGVNDIFTLFNNIACYYADDYTSKINSSWKANGVAALLGVCDKNGNSTFKASNSLWDNIDLAINKFLPVLGVLQGNGNANFSSYSLIWETIVEGVLDIGSNQGVTNFIKQLLTIVSASPIQSERIVDVVYDLLKNLLNGLFGPRYDKQTYVPVPERSALSDPTNPFDSFFHVNTVVGSSKNNYGALPKLLNNLIEFSGVGSNNGTKPNVYPDSILRGLTFAVTAVNSFLSLLPTVGDHQMNMATSSFKNLTTENASASTTYTDTITFKNNCIGINKVYLDGTNDNSVVQMSRYFIDIKGVTTSASGGSINVSNNFTSNEKLAPGAEYTINVSMQTPASINASYVVTTTYDICDANGNAIQTGLKTSAYKYITGDKSWLDTVYPAVHGTSSADLQRQGDGIYWLKTEPNAGKSDGEGDYVIKTTDTFQSGNNLNATYPQSMVITSSNASQIDTLGMRLKNTNNSWFGSGEYSMDGVYMYDSKTVYNDATGGNVTVGQTNAIPVFDKATGSLLKYGMLDYLPAGAEDIEANWVRNGVTGYTEGDIQNLIQDGTLTSGYKTRTHVAYTLQEAINANIIGAYHYNEQTALYEYVYLKQGGTSEVNNYDATLKQITLRGPVDGIIIQTGKITQAKNSSTYFAPFAYDGKTQLVAEDKNVNICFFNSGKSGYGSIHFVVADDSSKQSVVDSFNELSSILDNYTPEDFGDYENGVSPLYNEVQNQLIDALKAYAMPVSPSNGASLSDQLYLAASTTETTSELGDVAYEPFLVDNAADLPAEVRAEVTFGDDGIVYYDEAMTIPVYSNTLLSIDPSEADEDGIAYDAAWQAVKQGEDGNWYLVNAAAYDTDWTTDAVHTYPIKAELEDQKTTNDGKLVYNQVTYVYRDAAGEKVNSTDEWVVKFPATEYKIYPFDSSNEYRGLYTQISDNLAYYGEQVHNNLNTETANGLFENITLYRTGLNSANFDQVTFQRMVEAARDAERKFSVNVTYIPKGEDEEVTYTFSPADAAGHIDWLESEGIEYTWATESDLSTIQAAELQRLFDLYLSKVMQRGYMGSQIEAEILCASGNSYDNLTVTAAVPAELDKDGNEITAYVPATIAVKSGSTCDYGTVVDGIITNVDADGNQAYTTESWNAYTEKLATAVLIAQEGNSTYAYAQPSEMNKSISLDDLTCANTACYTADSELQVAENTLVPFEAEEPADGITITGTITIANTVDGGDSGFGLVGIDVVVDGEVVATSAADGTFTAVVPVGTTELTITGPTTIDRTVALTATGNVSDVVIPICMADYSQDGYVTGPDLGAYLAHHGVDYDVYCDYNADGFVTGPDLGAYLVFHGQVIEYADLTIAD